MSDSATIADEIEARRRRARYRAWHRGMREVDLLLGPFADRRVGEMSANELTAFEALLDEPDQMLLGWIMAETPADEAKDMPLVAQIRRFHAGGGAR